MTALTVHRHPTDSPFPLPPAADPGAEHPAPAEIRVVAPGDVPDGAVVLAHVVAVPAGPAAGARKLTAVPPPLSRARIDGEPGAGTASGGDDGADAGTDADDDVPAHQVLVVDSDTRRVVRHDREVALTRREFELLEYLVARPGRVFTRGQLLAEVWGHDTDTGPQRTVDVHVARLRRKLGPHGAFLQSLRGVGYRWSNRPGADGGAP